MRLKVFCVYDSKVEAFNQPFIMRTKGEAIRAVGNTIAEGNSMLAKHPADYTLFEIGEWDEREGFLYMHDAKVPLGTLLEIKSDGDNNRIKQVG